MRKIDYGKIFERQVIKSIPDDIFKMRIKDTTAKFKNNTNPCDIIVFDGEILCAFELKSTQNSSLPFANIKNHQYKDLKTLSKIKNVHSGLLIEMRKYQETYYVGIDDILHYVNLNERKSFPINFLREKGILVNQEIKRKLFVFDIKKLLKDLKQH